MAKMTIDGKNVVFEGKLRWANVPPNAAKKPYEIDEKEPNNTSYSIEVECSTDNFNKLMKEGLPRLTSLKEDEQGLTYIRLKSTKVKCEYTFADPKVLDKNGNDLGKKIANGSEGMVVGSLEDIKGRKGKVLRLKAVQVSNLIEYENDDDEVMKYLHINKQQQEQQHHEDDQNSSENLGDW